MLYAIYLSINKLTPAYVGLELGVGESLIMKAIADATGKKADRIKKLYKDAGDLGTVAMEVKKNRNSKLQ